MLDQRVRYFITVAEEGSFSSASRKLYLSQANLSKQVSSLENELGIILLDRSGYRPKLTDAGRLYYKECKKAYTRLEKIVAELKSTQTIHIKIGYTGAFENRRILKLINQFKKENPQYKISLEKLNFTGIVENLLNGNVDVSFGLESSFKHHESIHSHVLYNYNICLICSLDHPLAKENEVHVTQFKDEPMIIFSKSFGKDYYEDFFNACKLDGFEPNIQYEADSFDELMSEVAIGDAISIVSKEVVSGYEVHTASLLDSHHNSSYSLGYKKDIKKPGILYFINYIESHF